jgi:hypothetical protein
MEFAAALACDSVMKARLVIGALLVAAGCRGGSSAVVPPGSRVEASGACPRAHFAVSEEQVRIYEVTPACTVELRNTLEGVAGFVQWPAVGGDLVVYDITPATEGAPAPDPVLRQLTIASPLTARGPAPAWKTITFGEGDDEGQLDWSFASDGRHAYAIACADWEGDNEEEWHCGTFQYLRSDGQLVDETPVPAFARAVAAGPIADGVTVAEREDTFFCTSTPPTEDDFGSQIFAGEPIAVVPRTGARYFLYRAAAGSRGSPASGFSLEPMAGCATDGSTPGVFVPGPGGLVAHAPPAPGEEPYRYRIYRGDAPEPLLAAADGKPFETTGEPAWALE